MIVLKYGGRGAGAYLAYKFLAPKVGGGMLGVAAVVALGWLAGGIVTDLALPKSA